MKFNFYFLLFYLIFIFNACKKEDLSFKSISVHYIGFNSETPIKITEDYLCYDSANRGDNAWGTLGRSGSPYHAPGSRR